MSEHEWHEINEALARFADVEANWPRRVPQELEKITAAAEIATSVLKNHSCEVVVSWNDEADKIWDTIEVSLVRTADEYCFPIALAIKLHNHQVIFWRLLNDSGHKPVKCFVGERSVGDWVFVIRQMAEKNIMKIKG